MHCLLCARLGIYFTQTTGEPCTEPKLSVSIVSYTLQLISVGVNVILQCQIMICLIVVCTTYV